MADTWDDIGDRKKPSVRPKPKDARQVCREYKHEPAERMENRKRKNIETIRTAFPDFTEEGALVVGVAFGKRFEFWPHSDTYFDVAKGKYVTGIEALCEKVLKFKIEQERKNGG